MILDDRRVDLVEEGIDVSLRLGDIADSTASARRIGRSPRVVLGTPAYFAHAGEPQTPADLAAHEVVIYTQANSGSGSWSFSRGSIEMSVTVRGRFRASGAEGVRAAVLAGMGLAVASHWLFAPELADGGVVPTLKDWSLPPVDLWAVFPTGRLASAKARAFVSFIERGHER
jgi:DNA-binding transcriptional LysR family regulator